MLFAQYMCCSPSMEVQIEETELALRKKMADRVDVDFAPP